jgi:RND superfamily putative drug exporter
MIFRFLGELVRRWWFLLLAAWAAVLLGTWWVAPPWREVAQEKEFTFLPPNSPSRRAQEVYAKAFPEDRLTSNIVLVLHRPAGSRGHLQADRKFIEDVVEPGLRQIATEEGGLASEPAPTEGPLFSEGPSTPPPRPEKPPIVNRIRTPNAPGIGALLVSPDHDALLVVMDLTTEFMSPDNWQTITRVEDLVRQWKEQGKLPSGLDIALTGSAVIGRDQAQAELQSIRATGLLTVLLVIGLLLLIYRAPLPALIPLVTVYLTVRLALHILSLLGKSGQIELFQSLEIYITILSYGAGVDYCLFLMARYKEELDRGSEPRDAIGRAVTDVGPALAASAATVICGIAMMRFADFGKFREAGFAIPLSIALVLCATLTFSPVLLRLAGRWAFWPYTGSSSSGPASGRVLQRIWDRMGHLLLRRSGAVWGITAALMVPFVVVAGLFYGHLSYDYIGSLPSSAPSVVGTRVLQSHFPAGMIGPVTVLAVDPKMDFRSSEGQAIVRRITDRLRAQKDELGLADVRSLTQPLGITPAAEHPFAGLDLPADVRREARQRLAVGHYVSDMGGRQNSGTRLDLILAQSPFARASIEHLEQLEATVRADLPQAVQDDTQLYFVGDTANMRDLATVMQHDRIRIDVYVMASVLVVLMVLLRQVVVSLYLLASVLFSYFTTLGVTFAVFWALDPHGFVGIDWKVTVFLFTILVAVGEDYNILLMTRVREEQARFGPVRGITEALDRTGPIISSCGIIMAGTFGSLLAGSLTEMKQMGFALAFGILLDTFIVRPILVPAFLILLRTGRLRLPGRAGAGDGTFTAARAGTERHG